MTDVPLAIAVFAYNRPHHLARCLSDLQSMREAQSSHLRIYIDGAKTNDSADVHSQVVDVARSARGFASTKIEVSETNLGLAESIIKGVSRTVEEFGEAVVVEDDLRLSPHFLTFMRAGLDTYRETKEVYSIHGYSYPVNTKLPATFFLRGADCWGWATWSRAWRRFQPEAGVLVRMIEDRGLAREFDLDGNYPFMRMLRENARGRNDSWAIRWHASAFLDDALTLYPGKSLVWNSGLDGSGTHSGDLQLHDKFVSDLPIEVAAIPLEESKFARRAFGQYLKSLERRRVRKRLASLFGWGRT